MNFTSHTSFGSLESFVQIENLPKRKEANNVHSKWPISICQIQTPYRQKKFSFYWPWQMFFLHKEVRDLTYRAWIFYTSSDFQKKDDARPTLFCLSELELFRKIQVRWYEKKNESIYFNKFYSMMLDGYRNCDTLLQSSGKEVTQLQPQLNCHYSSPPPPNK